MNVIYVPNRPPATLRKSLFLAGPSPREAHHPNWRTEALDLLADLQYDGVVFVPLPSDGAFHRSYDDQLDWEKQYLDMADLIVFWIPRDLNTLPGFTTNVEFGMYLTSGRLILGYPDGATKVKYLATHARNESIPIHRELRSALAEAVERLGAGAERTNGEREVPLFVWEKREFQNWYQAQKRAGNQMNGAKLIWNFRIGPIKKHLFGYALLVDVHIAAERRNKVNEFIISRPDIATVCAYCRPEATTTQSLQAILDSEVVLIREFRSPARIGDCYVRELPGGSSWTADETEVAIAAKEMLEETGLRIDPSRLRLMGIRQVAATLSTHTATLFCCELTRAELDWLKRHADVSRGVSEDTECTWVEITTLRQLLTQSSADWANLGMIAAGLLSTI